MFMWILNYFENTHKFFQKNIFVPVKLKKLQQLAKLKIFS